MEREIVRELKPYIEKNSVESLQSQWELYQEEEGIAWDIVFKDVYLHACLKGKRDIVLWLDEIYKEMNPITQIALRQMFPYGRALLKKHEKFM